MLIYIYFKDSIVEGFQQNLLIRHGMTPQPILPPVYFVAAARWPAYDSSTRHARLRYVVMATGTARGVHDHPSASVDNIRRSAPPALVW